QTDVQSETYDLPGYAIDDTSQYTGKEGLTFIDGATAWDEDAQELTVFVINRNEDAEYPIELDVRGFEEYNFVKHIELCDQDLDAKNSFEEPDRIKPVENLGGSFAGGILSAHVKPLSWNVFRFEKKKA
ncbi:MAG: alpha-L-arabinofuranosidase, partial [Lachnospiraceae bacterium]|nr:alpha-L-arabinofuranosidase [Lachnospiraceae bacterium]